MEQFLQSENSGFTYLLFHILTTYLTDLNGVCVLWQEIDLNQISNIASGDHSVTFSELTMEPSYWPLVWLKYDGNNLNTTDVLVEMGINTGCQAFIVSASLALAFLDSYNAIRFSADNRYHLMHAVLLLDYVLNGNNQNTLNHELYYDLPNILIVSPMYGYNANINDASNYDNAFNLISTKFHELPTENWLDTIDTFHIGNTSFEKGTNLFPNKMKNLLGRPLRLSIFNYQPYSIINEVLSGQGNANAMNSDEEKTLLIDGTDGLMMVEFCSRRNCTLEVLYDMPGEWGVIYENATGDGVIGAVVERRAEIGLTALYSWHHEFTFMEFSAPITRTGVSTVAPRPKLLGGLLFPAMPFSIEMWLGVLLSFISIVISIVFMQKFGHWFRCKFEQINDVEINKGPMPAHLILIDIFGIYLSQSSTVPIKWLPETIIIGCILLVGLMIGNAYGGGLASIMTIPHYETPIDDVHQLSKSNLEWGATHDAWVFSILNADGTCSTGLNTVLYVMRCDLLAKRRIIDFGHLISFQSPDGKWPNSDGLFSESIFKNDEMKNLVKHFRAYPFEKLASMTKTRNFAFSVERLQGGNFAIGTYITEDAMKYLQLMKSDIYYEYCVAMFYKTWPMKSEFDLFALHVAETGIQNYWELQSTIQYSNSKVLLSVTLSRHIDNTGPVSLNLGNMIGVFFIWSLGIFLSLWIFIIELLSGWYKKFFFNSNQIKNVQP